MLFLRHKQHNEMVAAAKSSERREKKIYNSKVFGLL